jgi:hypothetical protein
MSTVPQIVLDGIAEGLDTPKERRAARRAAEVEKWQALVVGRQQHGRLETLQALVTGARWNAMNEGDDDDNGDTWSVGHAAYLTAQLPRPTSLKCTARGFLCAMATNTEGVSSRICIKLGHALEPCKLRTLESFTYADTLLLFSTFATAWGASTARRELKTSCDEYERIIMSLTGAGATGAVFEDTLFDLPTVDEVDGSDSTLLRRIQLYFERNWDESESENDAGANTLSPVIGLLLFTGHECIASDPNEAVFTVDAQTARRAARYVRRHCARA